MAAFTLSDLTLNEYATLARMISADPGQAMMRPDSVKYAEAHAGLCVMQARRDGDTTAGLADFMRLTLADITARLGLDGSSDDEPADPDAMSSDELAAGAAAVILGDGADPTQAPRSRRSGGSPGTPRDSSANAPASK